MRTFPKKGISRAKPGAHRAVKFLFEEMNRQQISAADLSDRGGPHNKTIQRWRLDRDPTISNLEAALNVLGFELKIGRKPDV